MLWKCFAQDRKMIEKADSEYKYERQHGYRKIWALLPVLWSGKALNLKQLGKTIPSRVC